MASADTLNGAVDFRRVDRKQTNTREEMMSTWSDDHRFAQQAGVAVEVHLLDGRRFFTGVADVDDENEWVSLYQIQGLQVPTTTVRVRLDDITSVSVTDAKLGWVK